MTAAPELPAGAATWTERRKADRKRMADALAALAAHHGATVSREIFGYDNGREEHVSFALNGLSLHLDFDGSSCQPDVHVCAWIIDSGSERELSAKFGRTVRAEVNPCHRRKCTAVAYGFADLYADVDAALRYAADESAFQPGWEVYASPRIALALFMERWGGDPIGRAAARRAVKRRRHGGNVRIAFFPGGQAGAHAVRNFASTLAEAVGQRYAAKGVRRYHGGEIFFSTVAGA